MSAFFVAGGIVLSGCNSEDAAQAADTSISIELEQPVSDRPNPPYFPLANGCALPDLSLDMEDLQTSVMERLSDGLAIADISPDVVQGGLVPTMQCGTQGAVSGDSLKLYLVDHNLIEVSRNRCENGTAYRGRVSTLNPTYEHGDFPKIQCAAMQLVMTGAYDVEICAEDGDISAMDIVPRADEPTTPGFTVESLKSTCSNDK